MNRILNVSGTIITVIILGVVAFVAVNTGIQKLVAKDTPPKAAHQYDDPAIAVCEFDLKNRAELSLIGYKRLDAKIDGNIVVISYSTSALITQPVDHTYSCKFVFTDTKFKLVEDKIKEMSDRCQYLVEHGDEERQAIEKSKLAHYPKIKQMARLGNQFKKCHAQSISNIVARTEYAAKITIPLAVMEIYPISQDKTKLAANQ